MEKQKPDKKTNVLVYVISIGVVLCICASIAATMAVIIAGESSQPVSELQSSTNTSAPATELPKASATAAQPSDTPPPTSTPAPTATPLPTSTPTATLPPAHRPPLDAGSRAGADCPAGLYHARRRRFPKRDS